jgi:protocatechuate 3,4-dioxygenase beta subunit
MAALGAGSGSTTTTDADGKFRFEGLPAGKVVLTATHPEYLEATREIDGDGEASADLTLSTGGSIRGTVVGKDRRTPAAGAQVSLREQGGSTMGFDGEEARTDGSGNFLFEHLKAGRYRLTAQGDAGASAPSEVVLAEAQRLDGVLLEMATGTLLRGSVTGLPAEQLGGVRIWAMAKDYSDSAVTDDQGGFTLRDVPPGAVRLNASTSWMSGRSAQKTVEVQEGAPEVLAEIAFEGASRLAGRVTRGEKPLPGLNVSASPDPPVSGMSMSRGQTDEDGRYALEGLADGSYQVGLFGSGVSYRKAVTVAGDTTEDIALPAVSLVGFVTESGSGEPIEGASVQAETGRETGALAMKSASTDSRGFYTLDAMDPGSYQVTARKDGYQLKTQTVSVGTSPAESNFTLARGAGVSIQAADGQTGLALRGLSVLAFSATGTVVFSGSVSLDSEGKGEISSLPPGSYAVYVFSQGYAPRSFPVVSVPSPTLAVAMTPGGRVEVRTDAPISGRILDASGAVYLLSAWRLDGRVSASPPVASWDNFAPGSYRLVATTPSGERSWPFTVSEGKTTVLEAR